MNEHILTLIDFYTNKVAPLFSEWWWLSFFALPFLVLVVPVSLKIQSHPWRVRIRWWGLYVRYHTEQEPTLTIRAFGYSFKRKEKKKSSKTEKPEPAKKKKNKPKKNKKHWKEYLALLEQPAVPVLLRRLLKLLKGIIGSFKIARLKWQISLDDYYQQGMLNGVLYALPFNRNFQIDGNFTEYNRFFLLMRFSMLRFLLVLLRFLLLFPYRKTWKLYKQVV